MNVEEKVELTPLSVRKAAVLKRKIRLDLREARQSRLAARYAWFQSFITEHFVLDPTGRVLRSTVAAMLDKRALSTVRLNMYLREDYGVVRHQKHYIGIRLKVEPEQRAVDEFLEECFTLGCGTVSRDALRILWLAHCSFAVPTKHLNRALASRGVTFNGHHYHNLELK